MTEKLLEAKNLHKKFDRGEILKGVSLSVSAGDVIAIVGPSGAGKTTLLRCLNLLERADEGEIVFDRKSYDPVKFTGKEAAGYHKMTGFVFQEYNLFANKTALENVTLGLTSGRGMKKAEAYAIGMEMLKKVGLEEKADRYPLHLSGGQQQRVAIARALAADPKIIFFDEPTSALDPQLTSEVLSVIRKLTGSGITMMIVTHELSFAKEVSTRMIFMEDGNIAEEGSTEEFFAHPENERTRAFLGMAGDGTVKEEL